MIAERGPDGEWRDGELFVGDFRGPPAILGMEEEVECAENSVAGYECDNVNIVSFLPIKDLGGVRGTRLNDIWAGRTLNPAGRSPSWAEPTVRPSWT